jgi:hypothetical protein
MEGALVPGFAWYRRAASLEKVISALLNTGAYWARIGRS